MYCSVAGRSAEGSCSFIHLAAASQMFLNVSVITSRFGPNQRGEASLWAPAHRQHIWHHFHQTIDGENEPLRVGPLQMSQTEFSGSERFLQHQNEAALCCYISVFPVSVEQHVAVSSLSSIKATRAAVWSMNPDMNQKHQRALDKTECSQNSSVLFVVFPLTAAWMSPGVTWCNLPVSMCRPSVCFSFSRFAPVKCGAAVTALCVLCLYSHTLCRVNLHSGSKLEGQLPLSAAALCLLPSPLPPIYWFNYGSMVKWKATLPTSGWLL